MRDLAEILPRLDEVMEFRLSLNAETDRGCALMAAAYLDAELESLLRVHFVQNKTVADDLLGQNRPLGTFSSRIDLAYALGLIPTTSFRDLHLIRKIRNDFAHKAAPLSFEYDPMAARCRELCHAEVLGKAARPRARFTRSVLGVLAPIQVAIQTSKPQSARREVDFGKIKPIIDKLLKEVLGEAADPGAKP
jgi:DNA-binding MltR family transcriptional regulator